jgi:L-alanine-DL-glutamate epimerase-like enolase superfamily enzyme
MLLKYFTYQLQFKNPFVLAAGTRLNTPAIFIRLEQDGICGWGEAAMPPYVTETQQTVINFLQSINLPSLVTIDNVLPFLNDMNNQPSNYFAKAALSNALLDWWCKKNGLSLKAYFINNNPSSLPDCCYTITVGDTISSSLEKAKDFNLIKIKAGFENDIEFIKTIAALWPKKMGIDANQGWKDVPTALNKLNALKSLKLEFIEQPLPKNDVHAAYQLYQQSTVCLIADESFQTSADLSKIMSCYHGINIKLLKCGGVANAFEIARTAKKAGLKLLLGCMSESSCGIAAAAAIQCLFDWTDLDGPLLINNDPFEGISYSDGKVVVSSPIGAGVMPKQEWLSMI